MFFVNKKNRHSMTLWINELLLDVLCDLCGFSLNVR